VDEGRENRLVNIKKEERGGRKVKKWLKEQKFGIYPSSYVGALKYALFLNGFEFSLPIHFFLILSFTMTKDNRDNTTEEHNMSPEKRSILGHHAALRGLNEWHQVCFQWCQQQQVKERCSMYCFKHNTITPRQDPPLPLSSSSTTTTTTTTDGDGIRNHAGKTLKHLMCQLADTLNDYSIVVVTGTNMETDKYIEGKTKSLVFQPKSYHITDRRFVP
jgi:hypothetical protein